MKLFLAMAILAAWTTAAMAWEDPGASIRMQNEINRINSEIAHQRHLQREMKKQQREYQRQTAPSYSDTREQEEMMRQILRWKQEQEDRPGPGAYTVVIPD